MRGALASTKRDFSVVEVIRVALRGLALRRREMIERRRSDCGFTELRTKNTLETYPRRGVALYPTGVYDVMVQ